MLRLKNIRSLVYFLMILVSLFTFIEWKIDNGMNAKWLLTSGFAVCGIMVLLFDFCKNGAILFAPKQLCNAIFFCTTFEAIYAIAKYVTIFSYNSIGASGSFENPVGLVSCLCIGYPFGYSLLISGNRKTKIISAISIFIIFIAIILSKSRIGILAFLVSFGFIANYRYKFTKKRTIVYIVILIILLAIGYTVNTDSVKGRFLIWRCCWNMMREIPAFGFGFDAFSKHYMDYQSQYFMGQYTLEDAMLADEVCYPFNEYFRLYINWGILGIALLTILLVIAYKRYKIEITAYKKSALISCISLSVLSMVSYPFSYPFTSLIVISCLIVIANWRITMKSLPIRLLLSVAISVFVFIATYKILYTSKSLNDWHDAYSSKNIAKYDEIYPLLKNNPDFLYNYSFELYNNEQYERSLKIAKESCKLTSSYDVNLLLGDICLQLNYFKQAEMYYGLATTMCPCRFRPLYGLFKIYTQQQKNENSFCIAQKINSMPIKIPSQEAYLIKFHIFNYLNTQNYVH